MAISRPVTDDQTAFLEELLGNGVLVASGAPGVYGQGECFERVRAGFDALLSRATADLGAEQLRFPPVVPRRLLEDTGYLASFPHLAGAVFGFVGTEAEAALQSERVSAQEDWSEFQHMTELMLSPAACYPVYPAIAARGRLAPGGTIVDTGAAWVFRNEPSGDPARLQSFQMHELVRIGEPEPVLAWRDEWAQRGIALLRGLGLDAELDTASDPFFGRPGRMLAASQREQELKVELLVQIAGPEPTAVASFNCHLDHFGAPYGVELADGGVAHSACIAFGNQRVALALLRAHGIDLASWPSAVRRELWPA